MVKSKELKLMRKRLEKADRVKDPLQLVHLTSSEEHNDLQKNITIDCGSDSSASQRLALMYKASSDLSTSTLQQLMSLFETNMGDFYRNSSWGLDLKEKADEFRHPKARFLILVTVTESTPAVALDRSCVKEKEGERMQELAGFVHFRFCYDDDDQPEHAVVYVYEIQVSERFRHQGLGSRLMAAVESMAKAVDLPRVMLTVFKANTSALQFYQSKLVYRIDESSPSQLGDEADFEILSKVVAQ